MRDKFPGFYERTPEEISNYWQYGIFVLDTNMLLNVYRYSVKTRERYFEILKRLESRLWIPYQVGYEYQDRRITVIQDQLKAYHDVLKALNKSYQGLKKALQPYEKKHSYIDPTTIIKDLGEVIQTAKITVEQKKSKDINAYISLKKKDVLRDFLDELLEDKIGPSYSHDQLEKMYQLAELRIERQIPPGLGEDEGKNGIKRYGDILLWLQIIDYACEQKKPIVFITDDLKKDWWLGEEYQGPPRPRPELIQEMFLKAGVLFHMYQGYTFLKEAAHFLKLEDRPDIVEEAKEISQKNVEYASNWLNTIIHEGPQAYYTEIKNEIKSAVKAWLSTRYPAASVKNPDEQDFGANLVVIMEEKRIGVELFILLRHSTDRDDISHDFFLSITMFPLFERPFDEGMVILACDTSEDAAMYAEQLIALQYKYHPWLSQVVIGYYSERFYETATISLK